MTVHSFENQPAILSLRKRWWAFYAVCGFFLVLGGYLLSLVWGMFNPLIWVLTTTLVLARQLWVLRASLVLNHRIGETNLLPGLGWGNAITMARGVLFAGLTGFVFLPRPPDILAWVPALLYTIGALIDFLDGYVARITNQVTRLGEMLDLSLDGWGMLAASILAVRYGQVPIWYLSVGLAMYLFNFGLWLRKRLGWPVSELPANPVRRPFAGLQMGFAFVVLWPVFHPPGTYHAALIFSIPSLAGFVWDWLVVSQTISGITGNGWQVVRQIVSQKLPIVLRLGAAGFIVYTLAGWGRSSLFLASIELVVLSAILLGTAGRIAAILGMLVMGFLQTGQALSNIQLTQLWFYGFVLYLGTGRYSIWKPEDQLITTRAGERKA